MAREKNNYNTADCKLQRVAIFMVENETIK